MAGQGGHRSLSVSLQASTAPACVIRLTPALLAALRAASDSGDAATISMGPSTNVLRVGATDFRFKSLPETLCDVITVPSTGADRGNTPSPALCAAHVCQKLVVTRDLGEERDRIRARGEEAERRLHGRRTVKLGGDGAEPPRGSVTARGAAALRPGASDGALVALAGGRGAKDPSSAGSSMRKGSARSAAGPRPVPTARQLLGGEAAAPRARTLPPPQAQPPPADAPRSTTDHAPTSSRRAPSPAPAHAPAAAPGSVPVAPSEAVLAAARGRHGVRAVLLAALGERPLSMASLRALLTAVAARVPGFVPPATRQELQRAVAAVASFQAPGRYVLLEGAARGEAAAGNERRSSAAIIGDERRSGAAIIGDERRSGAVATLDTAAQPAPRERPPASPEAGGRGPLSPDTQDASDDLASAGSHPAHSQAGAGGEGGDGNVGAQDRAAGGTAAPLSSSSSGAARRQLSASSRCLDDVEDGWVGTVADSAPRVAPPVTSREEYMELQVEFNRRYEQYFRLHQVLQANRNDFAAWREALESPGLSAGERARIEAKIQERWDRQAQRAKRWDAAFRVLHVELESMKAALGEFVRGMEEGEGARSGGAIASEA
ncbi:hypothetical protein ACKKBG_A05690 [Auxenochlorella protothecoides x Auxenochlorella symbiontica]